MSFMCFDCCSLQTVDGQACHLTQCKVLVFPAASTTLYPMLARWWLCHHTGSHIRRQLRRLLCWSTGWLAEENDSEAATCSQCSCASCIKLRQVRLRTSPFLHHVLHWLDVTDRVRLCIQVYKCQHSMALGYLVDLCRPVSSIDSHKHLRFANSGHLQVPWIRRSIYGSRPFWYAGPSTSNAL